jgi:hypothetical protein
MIPLLFLYECGIITTPFANTGIGPQLISAHASGILVSDAFSSFGGVWQQSSWLGNSSSLPMLSGTAPYPFP